LFGISLAPRRIRENPPASALTLTAGHSWDIINSRFVDQPWLGRTILTKARVCLYTGFIYRGGENEEKNGDQTGGGEPQSPA
jgi:hypothetical protein